MVPAHEPRSVGAVGQARHNAGVRQGRAQLAGSHIPQAHRLVPLPRGKPAAVRAEGHRVDVAGVAVQHRQGRPRVHVPDPHRVVPRPAKPPFATERGQPPAVWGERHPGHGSRVAEQDRHVLPTRRPPHADGTVGTRRGDPLPVRAVHGCGNLAGMAVVSRFDLPARRGVPLAHCSVRRGRHEARAVRAERGAGDLARAPPAGGEQCAGGWVPQARYAIFAG
jgi:hypothetical protein